MKKTESTSLFVIKFTVFSVVIAITAITLGGIITPSSLPSSAEAGTTIIVDAGHGGFDGGAVADDGTLEKELNLSLARSLAELLEAMGADVIMTRTDDAMLCDPDSSHKKLDDLNARAKMANDAGKCVFVSIHMNKFPVPKYSGLQVYYSPNNEGSKELADAIQNAARTYISPENNRKTKKAGDEIYLMKSIFCPAVLVECGFLSNPEELEKLKNEEYRDSLALVIAAAVSEFVSTGSMRG